MIAIKGARVSDFGGRSLSVLSSSTVIINPDSPEAFKLRGWYECVCVDLFQPDAEYLFCSVSLYMSGLYSSEER